MRSSLLLAGSLAVVGRAASVLPLTTRQTNTTQGFSWVDTKPTRDLQYHDCGGGFQCARLEVPLDWSDPSKNGTAAIAILKLPATVPDDDPSFGGSILINPGGPGGSGTSFAQIAGPVIQTLLGGERNYEIIGFDPRGVNVTTPRADCYDGNEIARLLDNDRLLAFPAIENALEYHYQYAVGMGQLCEDDGDQGVSAYVNTASVARDMVEIIDRIDELRWKNAGKTKPEDAEVPRLQYIGISYGSYLGNVFASMFPERIGRVMVDGIVDAEDWVAEAHRKNLNDAESIVDLFYKVCFESGEDCPIWESSDRSGADIKGRVNEVLAGVKTTPIPFPYNDRINFITPMVLDQLIFARLYNPPADFEILASGLAALLGGNYTALAPLISIAPLDLSCDSTDAPGKTPDYTWDRNALQAIACSDTVDDVENRTISRLEELVKFLNDQYPGGGFLASAYVFNCAGRTIRPPYAFTGPFGTPAADPDDPKAPAAPLLIASTRLDPITPLRNAVAMQKVHAGSAVVIQEAAGHTAISQLSPCLATVIREFFHTGKVPENGTVCEATCLPSIPASKSNCSSPLEARDGNSFVPVPIPEWRWL